MDDALLYLAVIAAGAAAGFINTLAGSGSAITLPLLVFMGLPASVANGTNRIGVLFQTGVSTISFHRAGVIPWRSTIALLAPSIVGAIVGASIAVDMDEQKMRWAIGGMLVLTFFLLILRPQRWLQPRVEGDRPVDWRDMIIFFLIGLYGGFIQAGVGIFLLVGLVMGIGFDLVGGNAIKSVLTLAMNIFAFAIFVWNGQVDWLLGFILAIGNVIGAWAAVHLAIKPGAQVWIYRLLLIVVVFSAARMFLDA
ncbi:MAG: sulfite exporter TauE/SafE family protein [Caldilineales bacterium]|nr:sulfite exporter TauE/SafE family protein [Caldilineales bacterium]